MMHVYAGIDWDFWKRSALPLYLGDRCKSVANHLIQFSTKRQINVFPTMQNY